jgi:hypothetical protein
VGNISTLYIVQQEVLRASKRFKTACTKNQRHPIPGHYGHVDISCVVIAGANLYNAARRAARVALDMQGREN